MFKKSVSVRPISRVTLLISVLLPLVSQAAITWSACGTITSVSNYLANDNSVYVTLSGSAIPSSCAGIAGVPGSVAFAIGQEGISSTNVNALLATALSAQASGQQVMIAYDNSTSSCFGQDIAVGGYAAQCP